MDSKQDVRFAGVMKTVFRMIRMGMPKYLLCLLGVTLAGLGSYLMSLLFGLTMSVTMRHYEAGTSAVPTLLLLLGMLASFVPLVVLGYQFNLRGALGIRANIQKKLLSAWLRQTENFAARHHSGEAMALFTSDMQIVENFYFQGLMTTFFMPFVQGIAALITIAVINIWLVFVPVFFRPVRAGRRHFDRRTHPQAQRASAQIDRWFGQPFLRSGGRQHDPPVLGHRRDAARRV